MSNLAIRKAYLANNRAVYSAWEPASLFNTHSTITSTDGKWWGQVGTRTLPALIEAMPVGSAERCTAVDSWHYSQYVEARNAIIAVHPEAADGFFRDAEIEVEL